MALARLASTALDCSDPSSLAEFWAQFLDGELAFRTDDFCAVRTDNGWITAVKVPDYVSPTWPSPTVPKQMHLDLKVEDLDVAEAEAVRLGATKAGEQPDPSRWRVLFDPAGHPFCLSTQVPD